LTTLGAALPDGSCVEVSVNGNQELATAIRAQPLHKDWVGTAHRLRFWSIALGDKAYAWNEYVHRSWPGAALTFLVDGYARVHPLTLTAQAEILATQPQAMAAIGVRATGLNAERLAQGLQQQGGLHCNLLALRDTSVQAMGRRGAPLQVGRYRADSSFCVTLVSGLDLPAQGWEGRRFRAVTLKAKWTIPPLRLLSWNLLQLRLRLCLRRTRDDLENSGARYHRQIQQRGSDSPAPTVETFEARWAKYCKATFSERLLGHPLLRKPATTCRPVRHRLGRRRLPMQSNAA
jgi:hypothetical protein